MEPGRERPRTAPPRKRTTDMPGNLLPPGSGEVVRGSEQAVAGQFPETVSPQADSAPLCPIRTTC
ncbi:hypothetical protein Kisp02_71840 [Kineosporia sp. NBRC 101731]|nr:hypothetical protein Kisp02_71840 [Kineosporia sp. NBRC 101731]